MRKTRLMLAVEAREGRPLEELFRELVPDHTFGQLAERFGVSKATLGYWMLKLGLHYRRILEEAHR